MEKYNPLQDPNVDIPEAQSYHIGANGVLVQERKIYYPSLPNQNGLPEYRKERELIGEIINFLIPGVSAQDLSGEWEKKRIKEALAKREKILHQGEFFKITTGEEFPNEY